MEPCFGGASSFVAILALMMKYLILLSGLAFAMPASAVMADGQEQGSVVHQGNLDAVAHAAVMVPVGDIEHRLAGEAGVMARIDGDRSYAGLAGSMVLPEAVWLTVTSRSCGGMPG